MSSEKNKTIARRAIDEIWSQGKLDLADEVIADHYVYHEIAAGDTNGREALNQLVTMYRTAYPDLRFTVLDAIAEGDRVVLRWKAEGTHEGVLMGIPATGKRTTAEGINIIRYQSGMAVEEWTQWDVIGLMRQLGAIPPME